MKFETDPSEVHQHGLIFEASEGEVEVVAAMTRERIFTLFDTGASAEVAEHEYVLSKWTGQKNEGLHTNTPLETAEKLEWFKLRTKEAIDDIVMRSAEPPFDNNDITRRLELGEKALLMAGHIRVQYQADSWDKMLDESGASLFMAPDKPVEPRAE